MTTTTIRPAMHIDEARWIAANLYVFSVTLEDCARAFHTLDYSAMAGKAADRALAQDVWTRVGRSAGA